MHGSDFIQEDALVSMAVRERDDPFRQSAGIASGPTEKIDDGLNLVWVDLIDLKLTARIIIGFDDPGDIRWVQKLRRACFSDGNFKTLPDAGIIETHDRAAIPEPIDRQFSEFELGNG